MFPRPTASWGLDTKLLATVANCGGRDTKLLGEFVGGACPVHDFPKGFAFCVSLADAIALGTFVTVVESVGGLGAGDALAFFALLDLPEALTGDGFVCCHGSRLVSGG